MKKGNLFEKRVAQYLRDRGFPEAERRVMGGANDKGDVGGIPGVCVEIKNTVSINMGTAMKEATKEAKNLKAWTKAVVFNRINHPVDRAYVLMELADFATLLDKAITPLPNGETHD